MFFVINLKLAVLVSQQKENLWGTVIIKKSPLNYAFTFADVKQALIQWQERIEFAHKLLTLLNSYSPPELRNACIGKLLEK